MSSEDRLASAIRIACLMEATAAKPGNVHPGAEFADATFDDFVRSAEVVAPLLAKAGRLGIGRVMLDAVRETLGVVGHNTNLGIILLLAPLAAVPIELPLDEGISRTLDTLTEDDARDCYAAIRLAAPGGLGTADKADVAIEPRIPLLDAMGMAADRDRVAAQYVNEFADVLTGVQQLAELYDADNWRTAITRLHLELMAACPDTLIARKCGRQIAAESQRMAREVLTSGWPDTPTGKQSLQNFDRWLRTDGHRRNPGTTADLVAAILFAALRDGVIAKPHDIED